MPKEVIDHLIERLLQVHPGDDGFVPVVKAQNGANNWYIQKRTFTLWKKQRTLKGKQQLVQNISVNCSFEFQFTFC